MKAIFKNFLCVVIAGVAVVTVRGQDDGSTGVQAHFRTLGVVDNAGGGLFYSYLQKDVPISIDENIRSPFYDYKGPAVLVLYRVKTNADKSVERIPVATGDLTGKGQWPLLIFGKGADAVAPQVTVVADDLVAFPPNSYRFINHSKYPCSCVLGSKSFGLAADEIALLPAPPSDPTHHAIMVQVIGGMPRRLIYTSNWALQAGLRTMVFINESAGDFGVARRIIEAPDILVNEMKKHKNS